MNRRAFLKSFFAAGAVAVAAPKIYVLPPAGGWKLNQRIYSFKDVIGTLDVPDFHLLTATGHDLDALSYISNFARYPGETDAHLRSRVLKYHEEIGRRS